MHGAIMGCVFVNKFEPNCALWCALLFHQCRLRIDLFNDVTFSVTVLCHGVSFCLLNDAVRSSDCVWLSDVTT